MIIIRADCGRARPVANYRSNVWVNYTSSNINQQPVATIDRPSLVPRPFFFLIERS